MKRFLLSLCLTSSLMSSVVYAQDMTSNAAFERLERMERDLQLLQRQVSRNPDSISPVGSGTEGLPANPAQLEVRLGNMEEQIRVMRGKVEENEFKVKKLTETLEKFQRDTEFRFNEIRPAAPVAGAPINGAAVKPTNDLPTNTVSVGGSEPTPIGAAPAPKTEDPAVKPSINATVDNSPMVDDFPTPREHYNYAFRLLNQTQYDKSAKAFDSFTKKYPKDPLVGNAYYWQGETHYIRHDYANAADSFRQGFEVAPSGPKSGDNLLKLAMSLSALKRDKEACVVLDQVASKYGKTSNNLATKAQTEQKRIGCQ